MANLLSRKSRPEPFPAFDAPQRARLIGRVRSVVGCPSADLDALARSVGEMLEAELEELDEDPTLGATEALLERIEAGRRASLPTAAAARASESDAWLCHWPGRSLATGEAEIASRGFFDVHDRPPLSLWVAALARRRAPGEAAPSFEIAVLCRVPAEHVALARAGCDACPNGALALLDVSGARDGFSDALLAQLRDVSG